MSWFNALLKCIFCCQDDDYNEREEGNRYCQSDQGTAVGRSSFHPRSSGNVQQFDSKTRALLWDVKLAHSSVADVSTRKGSLPQSSKGPSITYERYVHPRIPNTSHVPPIVPIALPQQACPDLLPQTVVVKDWLSAYEDPLSSSSYASYAPPTSLSSNSLTKTKPPLSSSSEPSTYSPTKTPSISKPLSSSTSRSSAEHSFKSSSSSGKPPLSSMSKPSTSPPEKAPPVSKSWQPLPPPSSSSSSSKKSALPTFKLTLAPSSPSISTDQSRKTNYTCIEKGTYAPPTSLSSNSLTKTKPPLSSSSEPSTYSPTKTPSISKPLSSSTSRSSAEHSFKSSSSFGKPPLSSMSKPSTSPPEKAPPVSKSWQPLPPPSSSSSSSKKSALPTFKLTLAPSSPSISTDQSRKTNYTCIEKGTYAPPTSLSSNSLTKTKPPLSSSSEPSTYSPTKTPSISKPLSSSTSRSSAEHSFKSSSSFGKPPLSSMSKPSTSLPEKAPPVSKSWQPLPPPSSSSSSSKKSALPTFKLTLAPSSPSISTDQSRKTNYTCIEKGTTPFFVIPKDIVELIKKDIVPKVLYSPLSPSTYTDYFAALLYAEDFYCEKWSDYLLKNVTLELHEASIYTRGKKIYEKDSDDKTFVAFKMDSVPERRPFILSRDFVRLQPSDRDYSFQGVIYRVVKSKTVLAEFNKDFYAEHYSSRTYNVSFSFNRFCLKRAHQAIKAASNPLFQSFLFPADSLHRSSSLPTSNFFASKLDFKQKYVVSRILGLKGSPPFLVEGELSETGLVVGEAIVHIVRIFPNSRILVCAPTNRTCDVLMANLKKEISESDMFRANAAFRELDGVPVELLPSCRYNDECFTCPSLMKLKKFRVVSSTFVSSFRLNGEGITADHFTHIFLVDGSSVTEPELMIALATFANDNTTVVVTGASNNRSGWVRSTIARENGLRISYFERLCERPPYKDLEPCFFARLPKIEVNHNGVY